MRHSKIIASQSFGFILEWNTIVYHEGLEKARDLKYQGLDSFCYVKVEQRLVFLRLHMHIII